MIAVDIVSFVAVVLVGALCAISAVRKRHSRYASYALLALAFAAVQALYLDWNNALWGIAGAITLFVPVYLVRMGLLKNWF